MKGLPYLGLLATALLIAASTACRSKHSTPEVEPSSTPAVRQAEQLPKSDVGLRPDEPPSSPGAPGVSEPSEAARTAASLAAANPDYEAWFRKYHLDLNDPKMLDEDPDGDGYTNREEFLAGTDPRDPNSHPETHDTVSKDIRLKQYSEVESPYVLKAVDGEKAKIERNDENPPRVEEVRAGQTLKNTGLKVTKVQTRRQMDKEGNPVDASHVTLENTSTKEKTLLVKDLKTRSPASYAVLVSPDGKTTITVHQGDTFQWPGKPGSLTVVDLGTDQVLLRDDGGRVLTVKKW